MVRSRKWLLTLALVAAIALAGCARSAPSTVGSDVSASSASATSAAGSPGASGGDQCAPWSCDQTARFAAATSFVAAQAGQLDVVVRDRVTGARWSAGETSYPNWAGSTPKLALTVWLLEQVRAGALTLDSGDYDAIDAMLSTSSNNAADRLWDRYADPTTLLSVWRTRYGMTSATFVAGFPQRWGFVQLTATDLANLIAYILDSLDPADRDFLLTRMRSVAVEQQWGVWAAGADQRPGVKDGWSEELDADGNDVWIAATAGFAGPDERYIVAATYTQPPNSGSLDAGVHVVTDLVATIFGQPVPAPAHVPPPD